MTLLYIEGVLVDLPPDAIFAQTIQRLNFKDLATRKVDFTNSVKLSWTPTNLNFFGFALNEKSITDRPYEKLPMKLVQNGIETISEGLCWITAVDGSGVTIAIYDQAINIFTVISGKKLNRLSHVANSAWNPADIDSARTSTTGKISAVLDWGRNGGASIYNSTYFLPCFFYHDFIKQILQQTDLTLSGTVLTDQTFLDLVVPYGLPKFEYPASVNQDYFFLVGKDSISKSITIAADAGSPSTEVVQIDYDTQNPPSTYQGAARMFNTLTFTATVPDTGANNAWLVAVITGGLYFNISAWNPGDIFRFTIRVRDKNGFQIASTVADVDYTTFGAAPIVGLNLFFPQLVFSLSDGDQIDMTVGTLVGSGSGAITIAIRRGTSSPYNYIKLDTISGTVSLADVSWQLLLPDVLQTEMLRDFFVRFAIIPKQVGGTLFLKTLKEITEDTHNAVDWTSKRTSDPDQINYSPTPWAQSNIFSYAEDSGAGIEPDKNAGAGSIMARNNLLPGNRTLFSSFFEACEDSTIFSVLAALVRVYDSASTSISDFNNEPGLRLLTLRARAAAEPNITFNAIARNDYKVANFLYPTGTKDTNWNYFIDRYYGQVFINGIDTIRMVTRRYALNELDIASYDPHKIIFDNGSYFIIEKIENYIPGRITKVTMLKI